MPGTRWGVVYNADALSLDDMLRFAPMAEQAGAADAHLLEYPPGQGRLPCRR
jgi:hypothetical protein